MIKIRSKISLTYLISKYTNGISILPNDYNHLNKIFNILNNRKKWNLGLYPEGSRSCGKDLYVKSGFYHLAIKYNVPVVPIYLDYQKKRYILGQQIMMTNNINQSMNKLRNEYYLITKNENLNNFKLKQE